MGTNIRAQNFVATWAIVSGYQGLQVVEKSSGISRELSEYIRKELMSEIQNAARRELKDGEYIIQIVSDLPQLQDYIVIGKTMNIGIGMDGRTGTLCMHCALINKTHLSENKTLNLLSILEGLTPNRSFSKVTSSIIERPEIIVPEDLSPVVKVALNSSKELPELKNLLNTLIIKSIYKNSAPNIILYKSVDQILAILNILPGFVLSNVNIVSRIQQGEISSNRAYDIFVEMGKENSVEANVSFYYSSSILDYIQKGDLQRLNSIRFLYSAKAQELAFEDNFTEFVSFDLFTEINDLVAIKDPILLDKTIQYLKNGYTRYIDELQNLVLDYARNIVSRINEHSGELSKLLNILSLLPVQVRDNFGKNLLDIASPNRQVHALLVNNVRIFNHEKIERLIAEEKYKLAVEEMEKFVEEKDKTEKIRNLVETLVKKRIPNIDDLLNSTQSIIVMTSSEKLRTIMLEKLLLIVENTFTSPNFFAKMTTDAGIEIKIKSNDVNIYSTLNKVENPLSYNIHATIDGIQVLFRRMEDLITKLSNFLRIISQWNEQGQRQINSIINVVKVSCQYYKVILYKVLFSIRTDTIQLPNSEMKIGGPEGLVNQKSIAKSEEYFLQQRIPLATEEYNNLEGKLTDCLKQIPYGFLKKEISNDKGSKCFAIINDMFKRLEHNDILGRIDLIIKLYKSMDNKIQKVFLQISKQAVEDIEYRAKNSLSANGLRYFDRDVVVLLKAAYFYYRLGIYEKKKQSLVISAFKVSTPSGIKTEGYLRPLDIKLVDRFVDIGMQIGMDYYHIVTDVLFEIESDYFELNPAWVTKSDKKGKLSSNSQRTQKPVDSISSILDIFETLKDFTILNSRINGFLFSFNQTAWADDKRWQNLLMMIIRSVENFTGLLEIGIKNRAGILEEKNV